MTKSNGDIARAFSNTAKVTEAIQAEIHSALLRHKQAGSSVCLWQDEKVVWVAPEDIPDSFGN